MCETYWQTTGLKQAASTRTIAQRQLDRLSERGLSLYSSYEMEMMLLNPEDKSPITSTISFSTTQGLSKVEKFVYDVDKHLAAAGVYLETLQTEYAPGQLELVLTPVHGIHAADSVFIFKQAVREIAAINNMVVSFMSMPVIGVGTGMHYNFSVENKSGNIFYDPKQTDNLSAFAKHWVAGLLHHAPALAALNSPTINCYRRYHAPWSPDACNWGLDDRMAAIRVKNNGASGTYIENRMGSGAANPYLVMASTIAAGLDGVDNKLECPPAISHEKEQRKMPYDFVEAMGNLKVRAE